MVFLIGRLPTIQQEVQQRKLLYMGLYLLIWGEAANLRFMPECLCYIYHHVCTVQIVHEIATREKRIIFLSHFFRALNRKEMYERFRYLWELIQVWGCWHDSWRSQNTIKNLLLIILYQILMRDYNWKKMHNLFFHLPFDVPYWVVGNA